MKPAFLSRAVLLLAVLALSGGLAQSLVDEQPEGTILTPPSITEPTPEPATPTEEPAQPEPAPEAPEGTGDPATEAPLPSKPVPDLPNTIEPVWPVTPAVATPAPAPTAPARATKPTPPEEPANIPQRPTRRQIEAGDLTPVKPAVTTKPAPKPVVNRPAPRPVATRPTPKRSTTTKAAPARARLILVLKSTGYNSHRSQTDSTPFITATGARVRFGVVALSRDLLRRIPYGSKVLIEDLGTWNSGNGRGRHRRMLSGMVFVVEDTMHPRKAGTVDVWFPARRQAIQWGARRVRITVIQYGR